MAFGRTLTPEPNFLGSILGSQFSLPIFLRFAHADAQQLLTLLLLLLLVVVVVVVVLTDVRRFYCIVKSASMIKDRHEINVLFLRSAITLAQLVQLLMHKFIQKRQFEKLKTDVDVQIYFNLNGHITCFVLPLEDPRTQ